MANMGTSSFVLRSSLVDLPASSLRSLSPTRRGVPDSSRMVGTSAGSMFSSISSTEMFGSAPQVSRWELFPMRAYHRHHRSRRRQDSIHVARPHRRATAQMRAGKLRPLAVLDESRHALSPGVRAPSSRKDTRPHGQHLVRIAPRRRRRRWKSSRSVSIGEVMKEMQGTRRARQGQSGFRGRAGARRTNPKRSASSSRAKSRVGARVVKRCANQGGLKASSNDHHERKTQYSS